MAGAGNDTGEAAPTRVGIRAAESGSVRISDGACAWCSATGVAVGGGLTATVVTVTYHGDKIEFVMRIALQGAHMVRFNPPEGEGFAPGSEVAIDPPSDGVRLLPPD